MHNMIKRAIAVAMLVAVFFISKAVTTAVIDARFDNVDFHQAEDIVEAMEAEGVTGRFIVRSTPFYSIHANVPEEEDYGSIIYLDEEEWKHYAIAALTTLVVGEVAYVAVSFFKRHRIMTMMNDGEKEQN